MNYKEKTENNLSNKIDIEQVVLQMLCKEPPQKTKMVT